VAEALHDSAAGDVARLTAALAATWSLTPATAILSRSSPRLEF
jgi:hypothetical protein